MKKILHSNWLVAFFLFAILLTSGCSYLHSNEFVTGSVPTEEPSPQQVTLLSPTSTPILTEVLSIAVAETPVVTPIPSPTPTATPEPTDTPAPTEIPFSYYAPTVKMSFEELVGASEDFNESDVKDESNFIFPKAYPAPDTYKIIVDLYWQVVMVYSKDDNGAYTIPVRYMLCSTGSPKYGETRVGEWKMKPTKVRFGNFNVSGESAQYWTLIYSRTYFHSVLYAKYRRLNTLVVDSYKNLGTKQSHGCIRLTVPDARWMFYHICYDTICEIRKGSRDDTETENIRKQLVLPEVPASFDITVGGTPYTDNWSIDQIQTDENYPYVYATQPPVPKS